MVVHSLQRAEARGGISRMLEGGLESPINRDAIDIARRTVHGLVARSALLRVHAQEVLAAMRGAGVPTAVIKGAAVADRLFRPPSLRCFNDIDLIVPRSDWEASRSVMQRLGFRAHAILGTAEGSYGQEAWSRPDDPGVVVEIHWDLVNVPSMRAGVSVVWEDFFAPRSNSATHDATLSPAALLLIASVHGGAGHRFDRLGYLCDVLQCARGIAGPIDTQWLRLACGRTGAWLSVAASLRLAAQAFDCDQARGLAAELSRAPGAVVAFPLSVRQVLRSQGSSRALTGIQRQFFRQRLKRPRARRSSGDHPVGVERRIVQ